LACFDHEAPHYNHRELISSLEVLLHLPRTPLSASRCSSWP
jgi:hypothetical protein